MMKRILIATLMAVGGWASQAGAQIGLYGAPEAIDLGGPESAAVPRSWHQPQRGSYRDTWEPIPRSRAPAPVMDTREAAGVYGDPSRHVPEGRPVAPPRQYERRRMAPGRWPQPAYVSQRPTFGPSLTPPRAILALPERAYAEEAGDVPGDPSPEARPASPAERPVAPPPRPGPAPDDAHAAHVPAPTEPKIDPVPMAPEAPAPHLAPPREVRPDREGRSIVDQLIEESKDPKRVYGQFGTDQSPLAQAACGPCAEGAVPCDPPCDYRPWYASASMLVMGRDEPNRYWTSYETGNNPNQLLHTNDIHLEWRGGGEIRFGRRFCCGTMAVEAAYWTLKPFTGHASITHASGVSTPIDLRQVWFYRDAGDWDMAADLFDGAVEHRISRRNEVHNVEINFLRTGMLCDPQIPLDVNWGLGVRWFHFEEDLTLAALRNGTWGADPTREAYLDENLVNNLVGLQMIVDLKYYIHPNWRLSATPRIGIYNNHVDQNFRVYRGDGTVAAPQPGSGVAGSYPVQTSTDTLSFLTEVDLGVDWRFARNWSAGVGYRVVIATGLGLADNQIPHYLIDLPEVGHIDHNGHLILHGAFARLTYNF